MEDGWIGTVVDINEKNVQGFSQLGFDARNHYLLGAVKAGSMEPLWEVIDHSPDVFSLDIDSYDYFVADWLFRGGFRPRVVCVETNTFIPRALTVPYRFPFSRYALQPGFGLYFGCALDAWQHLWKGYRYCGMDRSGTNAFFALADALLEDLNLEVGGPGWQTYFCKKYSMSGDQLRRTLEGYEFLDVATPAYEEAFRAFSDNLH